ncbi:GTP-binding protein HflX [Desulfatibacillum alkenivorans DSM 16219]|uniref:GTPase HflX n=1 Tax=Desulfatibacillum alkenivorans DSM 16219 TaxID=1121393 RepID=A0A1M6V451_9BACT|nr:GTPase HflX [Desulfatibacillum alkenivorans]SHK76228.1 GTP-binding protein HflX [Desulfatibacillum alkenivorans DSM 16219]
MKKVYGYTKGLKTAQLKHLEKFYNRKVAPDLIVSQELALDMGRLSAEIRRQIGILVDRLGRIRFVMVGDGVQINIPSLHDYRAAMGRLNGLRLIHTHLKNEPLTDEDLTDLALLRLDLIAAVTLDETGAPHRFHAAHLIPSKPGETPYEVLPPMDPGARDISFRAFVRELEAELVRSSGVTKSQKQQASAFLVSVTNAPRREAADSMTELKELCRTNDIFVAAEMIQHRTRMDARFLMGKGKIRELTIAAMQYGVDLVIFDQDLNPSQIQAITNQVELPVIDRTQLILDIFAQRAMTSEGKLQVELAQLKYMLPRLLGRGTAMSRLMGGIGGRGPGETKLEVDRRRVRERITRLEKSLKNVSKRRQTQKSARERKGLPIVSIVGYTNAGKSTLLNTLTQAEVLAESKLFATLDPTSRRLRFPEDKEIIITDTVGFIRDLPKDLVTAFAATLEELKSADLLLHVIDASNPRMAEQVESVDKILEDIGVSAIPTIRVLNKADKVEPEEMERLCRSLEGMPISALDRPSLRPLTETIMERLFEESSE